MLPTLGSRCVVGRSLRHLSDVCSVQATRTTVASDCLPNKDSPQAGITVSTTSGQLTSTTRVWMRSRTKRSSLMHNQRASRQVPLAFGPLLHSQQSRSSTITLMISGHMRFEAMCVARSIVCLFCSQSSRHEHAHAVFRFDLAATPVSHVALIVLGSKSISDTMLPAKSAAIACRHLVCWGGRR